MRSHRRRQPLEHLLVAGDVRDVPGIIAALAWLPADVYGQVIVEARPDEELPVLAAPPRVTVHRVEASPAGEGIAAGRAVSAWVEEWMPREPDERRSVSVWVGDRVDLSAHDIIGIAERL